MIIDSTLIKRLERLAAVRLDESSREKIRGQLEMIVAYFETIQHADAGEQEAGDRQIEVNVAPLREDQIAGGLDQSQVTGLAPDTVDGYLKVPRIIDRE